MGKYIINHSDGTPFDVYDLEQNGPGNISTPRQITLVSLAGGAGFNLIQMFGDLTYRFVVGFQFNIIGSGAINGLYTTTNSSFDGTHTIVHLAEVIPTAALPFGNVQYSLPLAENETSILLSGRAVLNFGEDLNENSLHILENFSNTTSPANPTRGQLWHKSDTDQLFHYNGTTWTTSLGLGLGTLSFIDPQHPTDQINPILEIKGDNGDVGLSLITTVNPNPGDSIFRVESSGTNERLRVEHEGYLSTSNSIDSKGTTLVNKFATDLEFQSTFGIISSVGATMKTGAGGATWQFSSGNPGTASSFVANDSTGAALITANTADDRIDITNDLAVNIDTLYVDASASNVGIGKVNPGEKLDVVGNITYSSQLLSSNGTVANPGISFLSNTSVGFRVIGSNLALSIGGADKLTFNSSGLVTSNTANYETLLLADNDIVNKKYVDDALTTAASTAATDFLNVVGDQMIGNGTGSVGNSVGVIKFNNATTDFLLLGEGQGNITSAPDIRSDNDMLISATNELHLNFDGGNGSTAHFQINKAAHNSTSHVPVFKIDNDGTVSSEIANYETLVVVDKVLPNKKYVDDAIAAAVVSASVPSAAKLYFYGFSG